MRHATRAGNKPSFWTNLKVNGCRGCQKHEEEETIHHVLSGGCEAVRKYRNMRYRAAIKRVLDKCKGIMNDIQNYEGMIQVDKAIQAIDQPRTRRLKKRRN
eukprot:957115-Pleurochrysis_carterae.AAC.1